MFASPNGTNGLQNPGVKWELSSAGSEHLPYKQRVTGSNPVAPTKQKRPRVIEAFFVDDIRESSIATH